MASATGVKLVSRTAEGKHTKRFIVLKKAAGDYAFTRSNSIPGYYETREQAQEAISSVKQYLPNVEYKVRQK